MAQSVRLDVTYDSKHILYHTRILVQIVPSIHLKFAPIQRACRRDRQETRMNEKQQPTTRYPYKYTYICKFMSGIGHLSAILETPFRAIRSCADNLIVGSETTVVQWRNIDST